MTNDESAPFYMEVEARGDVVIFRPRGHVTETASFELAGELADRIDRGAQRLVMDLAEVDFISSSCLGVFLGAHKRARETGASLVVAAPQPLVREIILTTRLQELFPIYDSVEEAARA